MLAVTGAPGLHLSPPPGGPEAVQSPAPWPSAGVAPEPVAGAARATPNCHPPVIHAPRNPCEAPTRPGAPEARLAPVSTTQGPTLDEAQRQQMAKERGTSPRRYRQWLTELPIETRSTQQQRSGKAPGPKLTDRERRTRRKHKTQFAWRIFVPPDGVYDASLSQTMHEAGVAGNSGPPLPGFKAPAPGPMTGTTSKASATSTTSGASQAARGTDSAQLPSPPPSTLTGFSRLYEVTREREKAPPTQEPCAARRPDLLGREAKWPGAKPKVPALRPAGAAERSPKRRRASPTPSL